MTDDNGILVHLYQYLAVTILLIIVTSIDNCNKLGIAVQVNRCLWLEN